MKSTLLAVFCSFYCLQGEALIAQTLHNDCDIPLIICDKSSIIVDSLYGLGLLDNELGDAPCLADFVGPTEGNSFWIRCKVAQSGTFYFTITPEKPDDDFDFVLYRLQSELECYPRTALRCMVAGPFNGNTNCLGPTGLSPLETDTIHGPGCLSIDNNFLAAVHLEAGLNYELCVQNFSSRNGFRIDFCGTALLGCETTPCLALSTSSPEIEVLEQWKGFYPNPLSGATITLDLEMNHAGSLLLEAIDPYGRTHARTRIEAPAGKQSLTAPLGELPVGVYWLRLSNGNGGLLGVKCLIVGA